MKILYTASVLSHICQFHLPVMEMLQNEGHTVHVAARNNLDEKNGLTLRFTDEFFDIPFQRSPRDKRNKKAYKLLKQLLNKEYYDVIICNTPVVSVLTRLAAKQARKKGTVVIYIAHGFHFYKGAPLKYWLFYPLERYMANRHTDILVTINNEDYERVKRKFHCIVKHIYGVGVRSERYHPASHEETRIMREKERLREDDFVVLCTKELMFDNNQKTILKAVSKIKKYIPELVLLLAGNGPDEEMLKSMTKELMIEDYVRFLGYRIDLENVVPAVDLVVSCSYREGMPLNIIEAMLCAKPVIASHNRGHDELIEDGKTGFLIDVFDVDGLAEHIKHIRKEKDTAESLGKAGYEKAQKYTADAVVEQFAEIIKESERVRS